MITKEKQRMRGFSFVITQARRVTTQSFEPSLAPVTGGAAPWLGNYQGLAAAVKVMLMIEIAHIGRR